MGLNAVEVARMMLYSNIYSSCLIEGLEVSCCKVRDIVDGKEIDGIIDANTVGFIRNMKSAWDFLLGDTLGVPNNIMTLREFNKIVGYQLFDGNGEIRSKDVYIGGTTWKPNMPVYQDIVDKMEELSNLKVARLRALKTFCYVARTQMFIDGNKRVAQLMANKILIENNIGILQVPALFVKDLKYKLVSYYESGDDRNLISFLNTHCILEVQNG